MKLQQTKNESQYFLTLPKSIVQGFGWQKHDQIDYRISGEGKIEFFRRKLE